MIKYVLLSSLLFTTAVTQATGVPKTPAPTVQTTQLPECGTPAVQDLINDFLNIRGTVSVSNDANNVYIKISNITSGYRIAEIKMVHGSKVHTLQQMDEVVTNSQGAETADFLQTFSTTTTSFTHTIATNAIEACFWYHVHIKLINTTTNAVEYIYNTGTDYANSCRWTQLASYCTQACPPPPPPPVYGECGQLHTQTPGGWGAPPNGKNPGAYLHASFADVFPAGLQVGCADGFSLTLTNAQAITDLLPTGGKAGAITKSDTDPASINNVLVGHLVALTLSVGFDDYDYGFSTSELTLEHMVIKQGPFKDKTVREFLTIANAVLGGCNKTYTASQVNETATAINENYVDGKGDGGYLLCPNK